MTDCDPNILREQIVEAIKTVKDPEIPVNIFDLGLIYDIDVDEDCNVKITMTLTTPNCPVADALPASVKEAVQKLDGTGEVEVSLTWEPSWSPEMMSPEAKAAMDMMGIDAANPSASRAFTDISVGRRSSGRGRSSR